MSGYRKDFLDLYHIMCQPNAWAAVQLGGYILESKSSVTLARCVFCNSILVETAQRSERSKRKQLTHMRKHIEICATEWATDIALCYFLDKLNNKQIDQFNQWRMNKYHKPVMTKWLCPVYGPSTPECIAIEIMCHAFSSLCRSS